eukprot:3816980-Rhodomonas_salina.1
MQTAPYALSLSYSKCTTRFERTGHRIARVGLHKHTLWQYRAWHRQRVGRYSQKRRLIHPDAWADTGKSVRKYIRTRMLIQLYT